MAPRVFRRHAICVFPRAASPPPMGRQEEAFFPLYACLRNGTKDKCKHGHPKDKQVSKKAKVVCRGVAAKHGLRIFGRRNALG